MSRPLLGMAFLITAVLHVPAGAQQGREVQHYDLDTPEGRLLGFYSSGLAATSLGMPIVSGGQPGIQLAFELTYLPHLNRSQRTAGFDKPEASNLSPVFPRPTVLLNLPSGLTADFSWLPPVQVADARANIISGGIRRQFTAGKWMLTPRLSALAGRVSGAITCSTELDSGSLEDQIYYAAVCHSRESRDYFEPTHLALDITASDGASLLGARRYLNFGVRHEATSFDIGVITANGDRDPDHPVLRMSATRLFAAGGLQWNVGDRARYLAEVHWTPGSMITVRAAAGLKLW